MTPEASAALIAAWSNAVDDFVNGRGTVGTLMKYGADLCDALRADAEALAEEKREKLSWMSNAAKAMARAEAAEARVKELEADVVAINTAAIDRGKLADERQREINFLRRMIGLTF